MKNMMIAANWKMNTNLEQTENLATVLKRFVEKNDIGEIGISIFPPFTNISKAIEILKDTKVRVGAQNCSGEENGAFTGEVSAAMIKDLGCNNVIIGHSERRTQFGEKGEVIQKKLHRAFDSGLDVIYCIGESLEMRISDRTNEILSKLIKTELHNLDSQYLKNLTIAYEPVWAIGSGLTPLPNQIAETHVFIKNLMSDLFQLNGLSVPVLYGGSLNSKNAQEILSIDEVNGGLIGGASLSAESFTSIIETAIDIMG